MKIAFISDQFFPRTSADSEQIVSSLSTLGTLAEVTLISATHGNKKPSKKSLEDYYHKKITFQLDFVVHLIRHIRGLEKLSFAIRATTKLRKSNFDLVYTRNIPVLIASLFFTSLPVVFESYRPWPERNFLSHFLFKRLAFKKRLLGIVSHSRFASESFLKVGFSKEMILVAHNAFEQEEYQAQPKSKILAEYQIPKEKPILAYSGRVNKAKGVDRLFEIATFFPELVILIIGSEKEGDIEKEAQNYANIHIIPWLPKREVYSLLMASDILYIPPTKRARDISKNTVLPLKTFLYKATGKAILAPDMEDIRELLDHNKNAYLVEPDNMDQEKKGLDFLINNPTRRDEMGALAKKEMKELTWNKRSSLILNFLHNNLINIK